MSRYFISCDWGTSSLRLRLVEAASLNVVASLASDSGVLQTYRSWRESVNEPRLSFFREVLDEHLLLLESRSRQALKDIPMVISGMASASIGMMELEYASLPANLDGSGYVVQQIEKTSAFPHDILLVSGLKTDDDVMRGEETAVTGILPGSLQSKMLVILPGTHSKHVFIENEKILDFSTFMTGELFALLSTRSILSDCVTISKEENWPVKWTETFVEGIEKGVDENLLKAAFTTRTNFLFQKLPPELNYHFLSGVLIGSELCELKKTALPIHLIGSEDQLRLYSLAAEHITGKTPMTTESSKAVVTGQFKFLRRFFGY